MRKVTILYSTNEELTAFNELFRFITKGSDPDIEFITKMLPRNSRGRTWENFVSFDNLRNSSYILELGLHNGVVLVKCHKKRCNHASEFMLCNIPDEMLKFLKNDSEILYVDHHINLGDNSIDNLTLIDHNEMIKRNDSRRDM